MTDYITLQQPLEIGIVQPEDVSKPRETDLTSSCITGDLYFSLKYYVDLLVYNWTKIVYSPTKIFTVEEKLEAKQNIQIFQMKFDEITSLSYIDDKRVECIQKYCVLINDSRNKLPELINFVDNKIILNEQRIREEVNSLQGSG